MFTKKFTILGVLCLLMMTGCKGKVDQVKNSFWNGDKGITIGKALDNYKYFESKEWKLIKTENGREFVDFKGTLSTTETLKNIDKPINEAKTAEPNIDAFVNDPKKMEEVYMGLMVGGDFAMSQCLNKVCYIVANDVKKFISNNGRYDLSIQFKIDKDNKDKEKFVLIDNINIIDKATKAVVVANVNERTVLESIYNEKQLYGKDDLNGDPYWITGLRLFKDKVEEYGKKAAAGAFR